MFNDFVEIYPLLRYLPALIIVLLMLGLARPLSDVLARRLCPECRAFAARRVASTKVMGTEVNLNGENVGSGSRVALF